MYGSIVALITPFNINNEIDYFELFKLIDYQLTNKTDGILLLGSIAESGSLTEEEKLDLVKRCVSYINKRAKVIVGIVDNNAENIIKFSKLIEDLEFDYYQICSPFYTKSNESGLVKYFTYIADNVSKPIILDNDPSRSGVDISLDVIKRLSYHRNIIGVSESSANINKLIEYSSIIKKDFELYCGTDFLILPSLSLGCSGIISMIANAYPKEIKDIYDNFIENIQVSRDKFQKLSGIIRDLSLEPAPISIKYLLSVLGFDVKKVRMPLDECTKEIKRKIEEDCLDL